MPYNDEQRKKEIEQNHHHHLNEHEQKENNLTSSENEIDSANDQQFEQHENDRQFVDREELNNNTHEAERTDIQTVDHIPNEELNDKVKDERNKDHTKDTSSSEADE
ncbi:hypothetical protein [Caryophanon latum]|uniref:hypothetical protein n=1 Tax=Caryophanon latum TaxID=33977 RepID=UPI001112790D|nr:hypothetical protein [Caryophanon latum]